MQQKRYDRQIVYFLLFALTLAFYCTLLEQFLRLWTLDASGVSALNGKLPEWDFTNLWIAGTLARMGQFETLFNVPHYRQFLSDFFHAPLSHNEWGYPPHLLLIAWLLAHLSFLQAYMVWMVGTWAMLAGLLFKACQFDLKHSAIVLLSPAVFFNLLVGQNGYFIAFLLLGCLWFSRARPVLAGILLGVLSIKPHLCLIAAVALLAMGNWRALLAAALTAGSMLALTTLFFGSEVWHLWHDFTLPFMMELMEGPHARTRMPLAITPFYSLHTLGLAVQLALAAQWGITLVCMIVTWCLWRREDVATHLQIALTFLLTLLATPYAQVYDMVGAAFAVAMLVDHSGSAKRLSLYALWIVPMFIVNLNLNGLVIAPLLIAAPLFLYYPRRG